ncbi:ComEC/Rec2 family competence protein [Reinekea sp.]|jgi:competence protein ComEC|uniref:ComEC/Rec2 family competence protein n=1 Tax=Reinekea sp. TaxID=1970455 RepID=UPI00398A45DF
MFAFAGLLLVPWLWFAWGINIAFSYIVLVSLFAAPFLYWRFLFVLLIGLLVLGYLEFQTRHTLPFSLQHQLFPLTICADPLFKQYDDVLLGTALVTDQPSSLNLRAVSAALPNKFNLENTPGLCLTGVFRVKQPFGTLLPKQFNVDQYYFSQQIDAKVTLVSLNSSFPKNTLIFELYGSVADYFQHLTHRQLWAALVLGWSSGMSSELKALLAKNQLAHMFVVSGFHIGLIALMVNIIFYGIAMVLAPIYRLNIALRYSAVLIVTSFYVGFIGWPIPALRALIMAGVPLLSILLRLKLHPYKSILISALVVLLCFPETWLSIGNWLSFGSVLMIVMAYRWQFFSRLSKIAAVLAFQFLMSLLSLFWSYFYGLSFNVLGFVINLIASPVITFIIFPLALLVILLPNPLVALFEWVARYCLTLIELTAQLGVEGNVSLVLVVLCTGVLVLFLMWLPQRRVLFGWVFVFVFFGTSSWYLDRPDSPLLQKNELYIRLFDVGHGISALIKTQDKAYLYDTGGKIGKVESIYGRKLSGLVPDLSALIVSHSDSDHSAGAAEVVSQFPKAIVYAGQPELLTTPAINCHSNSIDSDFMFFIPIPRTLQLNDNDNSCILVLRNEQFSMIFTGDASRKLEYYLLQTYPELFPFDIVVLGHHGSDSSSSGQWLNLNKDALFVNSGADIARGHWPSKRITQWFKQQELALENTAKRGTIDIFVTQVDIRLKSYESAFRKRLIY